MLHINLLDPANRNVPVAPSTTLGAGETLTVAAVWFATMAAIGALLFLR